MANKVRVYGKAQNRTVLGIINAYLILNPKATLADLEREFPASLNTGLKAYKLTSSFVTPQILKEKGDLKMKFCFEEDPIKLNDGSTIYLFSLWQKEDFLKTIELAKSFDIEVADYKPTKGFEKGGYLLEYINGYTPVAVPVKKKSNLWLIILLLLLILGGLFAFFFLGKEEQEQEVVPAPVEEVVAPVIVEQIKEIQTRFNDVKFDLNKFELRDEAMFVLDEIVALMKEHTNVKLKIVGHTSDEGDNEANQLLSENRAKAAADYIKSKNISINRITYEGKGSSEPIDKNNRPINRRIEFEIIK